MASKNGEITVVEPNNKDAVVIDMEGAVSAMRSRLAVEGKNEEYTTQSCRAVEKEERTMRRLGVLQEYGGPKRVPHNLIEISPKAIAPEIVSIGPLYHGNDEIEELKEFESCKWWFLNELLSRKKKDGGPDLPELLRAIQKSEGEARVFYHEGILMSSPAFIQMMVLDGCFIIELFRHLCRNEDVLGHGNPILSKPWLIPIITRDLLKLENQLPFFVLERLFNITATGGGVGDPLKLLALKFFNLSWPMPNEVLKRPIGGCHHLLGLFHESLHFQPPFSRVPGFRAFPELPLLPEQTEEHRVTSVSLLRYWSVSIPVFCLRWCTCAIFYCLGWSIAIPRLLLHYMRRGCVSILKRFFLPTLLDSEDYRHPVMSIKSTTQLRPAGVKFKQHRGAGSVFEIKYTNRVLQIPPITINDLTITAFINCLAYEHYYGFKFGRHRFTRYIAFLSCLISSPRDVAILSAEGIITSYSYNDHYIAGLFSKLGEKLYFDKNSSNHYLDEEFRAVDAYYNSHWGTFMRTYFSTPWSFISVVSAVILLLLTLGQTVLAVLSYIHNKA